MAAAVLAEEAFDEIRDLLFRIVNDFTRGRDPNFREEAESVAYEAFVETWAAYRPERGRLSSYLYPRVRGRLYDRFCRTPRRRFETDRDREPYAEPAVPAAEPDPRRFLADETRTVIDLLKSPPADLKAFLWTVPRRDFRRKSRRVLRDYFARRYAWDARTIDGVFAQLTELYE